jgi:hypothetical protein
MMKIIHVSAEVNEDAANDMFVRLLSQLRSSSAASNTQFFTCSIPNHPLHTLAMTVSSALCNIPVDFIGVIAGGDLYGCVKSLCLVLRAQFSNTEEDDKALVPHLMVMGTLAKGVPASRRHFLKVLFPNRDLDAEDNHTGVGYVINNGQCANRQQLNLCALQNIAVRLEPTWIRLETA